MAWKNLFRRWRSTSSVDVSATASSEGSPPLRHYDSPIASGSHSGRIDILEGEGAPKSLARTPITRDTRRDLTGMKQERMRDISRHLWRSNPVAKRGIQNLRSFVTSEGFAVRATAADESKRKRVQRYLDMWWRENRWELMLKKRIETLSVDGELFFWIAPPDSRGMRKLCYILPEHVKSVQRDGLDAERLDKVILSPPLEFEYQGKKHRKAELSIADEDHPDGECLILQINSLSGQTRGLSDLLVVADHLDGLDTLLNTEIERVQFQRSYAWFVEIDSEDESKVIAARDNIRKLGPPGPGSVHVHAKSEQWDPKSPRLHLEDSVAFIKMVLVLCFGGLYMPEHYFASGGDVNKATSQQMDTPIFTLTRDRKKDTKAFLRLGAEIALRAFAQAGVFVGFSEEDFKFEVVSRDPDRSAYDLIGEMLLSLGESLRLGVEQGYLSDVEAAQAFRIAASGLGLGDFPGVDEDSLSKARDRAEKMLERDRESLKSQYPLALTRESQSPLDGLEIRAAEDDQKKTEPYIDLLAGYRKERVEHLAREQEALAEHVRSSLALVADEVRSQSGTALDLEYILNSVERWGSDFRKQSPRSDLYRAAHSARSWVDTNARALGLPTASHDGTRLYPDGREETIPWHARVGSLKTGSPGVARVSDFRSLDRRIESLAKWGGDDFAMEIRERAKLAHEKGWTASQFAGSLMTDSSFPGSVAGKITDKRVNSLENSHQQIYDQAEILALADYEELYPGKIKRKFVRVKVHTGPCDKCDPLHGRTFPVKEGPRLPIHPYCGCTYVPEFDGQESVDVAQLSVRLSDVTPPPPKAEFEPYKDRKGYLDNLFDKPELVKAPVVLPERYKNIPDADIWEHYRAVSPFTSPSGHLVELFSDVSDVIEHFNIKAPDEAFERKILLSAAKGAIETPDFYGYSTNDRSRLVFFKALKLAPDEPPVVVQVVAGSDGVSSDLFRAITWFIVEDGLAKVNKKIQGLRR